MEVEKLIPKVIHYCWFGMNPLPVEVEHCIDSWRKFCPDYQIIQWNENNYDIHKWKFTEEAYQHKKWAFVSDVARLDIIYQYGGFYLDTDVELVKSLDPLLTENAFMGFEYGRGVATGLGFGACKGNEIILGNLMQYQNMSFVNSDGSLNLTPCPTVTTAYLETKGLIRRDVFQNLGEIKIYPSEYFCPRICSDGSAVLTENTISIHRFAGTWTTEREKRAVKRRVWVYTKFGALGLSFFDGFVLLKEKGMRAFLKRLREKFVEVNE